MQDHVVLTLIWGLICVVVILGLAYWVTRYVAARGIHTGCLRGRDTGDLVVLSRLALGKDEQLVVVKAADRYFLLGVTATQITMLTEISPQEAAKFDQTPPEVPSGFGKVLKDIARQRERR